MLCQMDCYINVIHSQNPLWYFYGFVRVYLIGGKGVAF